ncbi:hypothetical protein AB1Y20_019863 [Prymnesium parvum]|uniref:Uncharacterized protein n=1 Tax=Prymnesium parvum TaxID=97485 RepID=A0AB34JVV4_PRYPA
MPDVITWRAHNVGAQADVVEVSFNDDPDEDARPAWQPCGTAQHRCGTARQRRVAVVWHSVAEVWHSVAEVWHSMAVVWHSAAEVWRSVAESCGTARQRCGTKRRKCGTVWQRLRAHEASMKLRALYLEHASQPPAGASGAQRRAAPSATPVRSASLRLARWRLRPSGAQCH